MYKNTITEEDFKEIIFNNLKGKPYLLLADLGKFLLEEGYYGVPRELKETHLKTLIENEFIKLGFVPQGSILEGNKFY